MQRFAVFTTGFHFWIEILLMRALLFTLILAITLSCHAETVIDTFPDAWPATDALGRELPDAAKVGAPRNDKFVGLFYFLWLGRHGTAGPYDISQILAKDPQAMSKPDSPLWGPLQYYHYWSESQFGYYRSDDPWVLKKHAQLLADAGVDVIIFDVTNQVTYPQSYLALCKAFTEVRQAGGKTPQIAFLTPFGNPTKVITELYRDFYSKGLFKELWFQWKGKPLIMADPGGIKASEIKADGATLAAEMKDFFTFRKPQPDYFRGPTGPDQWGWLEIFPQHVFKNSAGKAEQMVVGVGQNGQAKRLSSFSEKNTYGRSWHEGKKDERPNAAYYGFNFSEQFEHALKEDPEFIFITGWNEWIAGRFNEFNGVKEPVMFVDEYTEEYSRDIEPMRGGHSDSYYYQMISFIRRFKGARKAPLAGPAQTITIDGDFKDWQNVTPEFKDDVGDTHHRDFAGMDNTGAYKNTSGRNDFTLLKVARDEKNIYFYAQTAQPITPHTDPNWMLLFLSIQPKAANWEGYDFVVNRTLKDANTSVLEQSEGGWKWKTVGEVQLKVLGRELELAIPRSALPFEPNQPLRFDFKWADNLTPDNGAVDFMVNGDAAPNARFRYRFAEKE